MWRVNPTSTAKALLNLNVPNFNSHAHSRLGLTVCKEEIVKARNLGDDERAKELSQVFVWLKSKVRCFCVCGRAKSRSATYCTDCKRAMVAKRKFGMTMKSEVYNYYEIETTPHAIGNGNAPLSDALNRLLLQGKVGDSMVVPHSQTSIGTSARQIGIKLITRRLYKPGEKPLVRIWRSDGLKAVEVNRLLLSRNVPAPTIPDTGVKYQPINNRKATVA